MAIAESDVILWHDYAEGSGTSVADESGNDRVNSLQSSPSWGTSGVPSGLNGFIELNGTTQYGRVTADTTLNALGTTSFTLAAWVLTDSPTTRQSVFFKGDTSGDWFALNFEGAEFSNQYGFLIDDGADVDFARGGSVTSSTWLHVVATWDAAGEDFYVYVNNSQVASALNQSMGTVNTAGHFLEIGTANGEIGPGFLNGRFAQTIIFNRVLDSSERTDLYNSGDGKLYSDYFAGGGGATSPIFLPRVGL